MTIQTMVGSATVEVLDRPREGDVVVEDFKGRVPTRLKWVRRSIHSITRVPGGFSLRVVGGSTSWHPVGNVRAHSPFASRP